MRPEYDDVLRDRVGRLMGVLQQLAIARSRPIRHADGYDIVVWLAEAREHVAVQTPVEPGEEILRVGRVDTTPQHPEPTLPGILVGWVDRPPRAEPSLRPSGPTGPNGRLVEPDRVPGVRAAFDGWLRSWRAWADGERRRRPRQQLFDALFDMRRLVADKPESVELVVAAGLVHAPSVDDGRDLHVHVVTQPITVDQDPETGELVCRLVEGSAPRLEDGELLAGLELYDPSGSAPMRERLLDVASPLDPALSTFLKQWTGRTLTARALVSDEWTAATGRDTVVSVAPALVARRRGAYALREYYDAIAASVADPRVPVPLGLAQLVEAIGPDERLAWLERTGRTSSADIAHDPLFPLPANDEQAQIIRRLGQDSGVVVEGPPGTGKTHTIANLVSALLARGQRVLVTSEKAQALRVLRDKLPSQLQELCIAVTDASARRDPTLARSVATLAGRKADFDPRRGDDDIAELRRRRGRTQQQRTRLLHEIRALRESETHRHPEVAPGYDGTLADIARALVASVDLVWVPGEAAGPPPLDGAEFDDLVTLLRQRSPRRESRRIQRFPPAADVVAPDVVRSLGDEVSRGDAARSGAHGPLVSALEQLPADQLDRLAAVCRAAAEALAALDDLPVDGGWATTIADEVVSGRATHLWQRARSQLALVDQAVEADRRAGFAEVRVADGVDPAAAAPVFGRLAEHLAAGGSFRRLFKTDVQKDVERFPGAVLVNGAAPTTADAAVRAANHLVVLDAARTLAAAFAPLGFPAPAGPDRSHLLQRMLQLRDACVRVDAVLAARRDVVDLLATIPALERPRLPTLADLAHFSTVAREVSTGRAGRRARAALVDAAARLDGPAGATPPEVTAAVDALRRVDPAGYAAAAEALDRARVEQADQLRCDALRDRLLAASPELLLQIEQHPADPVWRDRATSWPRAWARACAATWLQQHVDPGREQRLDAELAVTDRRIAAVTADLAAALAWRACLTRMTASQVQALQAYRNAVSNIGKGTGKYAEKFRVAARDAMAVAQGAVPAWVMPIQQVLASVPPQPGAFDVVIVDEASQAELTSTFLLWLAPRVIVVGDDKQCSPSEVASGALEPVFDRLDAELADLPSYLRTSFTPKDSVFSLLRSRFGQVIRLREHFRCMPEIIEWSSREFYRDAPLIPVRQFGADRLRPLRATFVAGATVDGVGSRLTNRLEAEAIADAVAACVDDEAYRDRTFGVVVLQGQGQVDLIKQALLERLTPEEWERRRLRVGTPPDFQGDERHVVWLSMVVVPEQGFRALTRRDEEQRYNVAASRAKDQLWLFHSVPVDRLKPDDLRRRLLTHLVSAAPPLPSVLTDVVADQPHGAFDSPFEQEVFLELTGRGYHVTPQVDVNRRRIDLVVTGADGRLAVECDGASADPSPERLDADLQREQELKRCGWTFWRVRESSYALDPVAALSTLWPILNRLGIRPLGEAPVQQPVVVEAPAPATAPRPVEPERSDPTSSLVRTSSVDIYWTEPDVQAARVVDAGLAADVLDAAPMAPPVTEPVPEAQTPRARPAHQHDSEPRRDDEMASGRPEREAVSVTVDGADPVVDTAVAADDIQLLLRAAEQAPLSTNRVIELLGGTTVEARAVLARLVRDGLLVRTSQERGTRYVLPTWPQSTRPVDELGRPARNLVISPKHREQVLRSARHRPMTNENVRKLLGVPAAVATDVLTALVYEGSLERKGQGRGTYYVLLPDAPPRSARPPSPPPSAPRHAQLPAPEPAPPVPQWDRELGAGFGRALHQLCQRAYSELGYRPSEVIGSVNESGAVATAKRMLRPGPASRTTETLLERGRPDLTVEHLALRPRFADLFSEHELDVARERLDR